MDIYHGTLIRLKYIWKVIIFINYNYDFKYGIKYLLDSMNDYDWFV